MELELQPTDVIRLEIDPDAKTVIVTEGLDRTQAELFAEQLGLWWRSDDPFLLINLADGTTVRFERVE